MDSTILLVSAVRKQAADVLQKLASLGFESVDWIRGETKAKEKLLKKSYALAIIDLDVSQLEAAVQAGITIGNQFGTPLIYISKKSGSGLYNQLMQTRPWAFLSKPVNLIELQIAIENILHRRSPEQNVKESQMEGYWHTLVNNLPGLAYQCVDDQEWTMLFLSQGCKELTGYMSSDILLNNKLSYQDLIHPDDRENVREIIEQSNLERFELSYRIRTKEGRYKWVLERGVKTGKTLKNQAILEGVIVDIDEQKQAEVNLSLHLAELDILNSLNANANEGMPIRKIFSKLVTEFKKHYSISTNLYFLDKQKNSLVAKNQFIDSKVMRNYEQALGHKIPEIKIDLVEGSWHYSMIHGPDHIFTKDPLQIEKLTSDFTSYSNLKNLMALAKNKVHTKSVLGIKLKLEEETIGLMTLRSNQVMSDNVIQSILTVSDGISNTIARRITEEKLNKEEIRFRTLWEMAPNGIVIIDTAGYVRSVNHSFTRLTGFTESELVDKHIRDIPTIPKNSISEFLALFTKLISYSRSKPVEFRWMHKNGTLNWGEAYVSNLKENGELFGIQVLINDITQRKNNELRIKESESLYRTVFTKSPMSIILFKEGKIVYTNPVLQRLMGVKKAQQLAGASASDMVSPDYRSIISDRMSNLSLNKNNKPAIFKLNRQDQKEVYIESSSVQVVINGEKASLVMGRDISKQMQAEEKLREREQLLSSILQAAPIGIGLVKERVIYWVNDAFIKMVGFSKKELIGQNSVMIYPDRQQYEYAGKIKYDQIKRNKIGQVETKFKTKSGRIIDILLSSAALNPQDLTAGTTFTALDITEKNVSELILKENEEKYRTLFENMAQGVYYQSADGTLINVNKAALRMLGLTKAQFQGKTTLPTDWIFIDEDMAEILPEEYPALVSLRTGKKLNDVVVGVFNPRLNKFVWLLVNTQPQFKTGEKDPFQVFVTLHDMTDIKNAELELNKSYREIKKLSRYTLEVREEERKQIARNLHDELGQILTAVKMDISWIKSRLPDGDEILASRAVETLEIIDEAIGGVQRITSELRPPILDNLGLFEALKSLVRDFHERTGIKTNIHLPEKEGSLNPELMISLYRIVQEALTNVIRHAQATHVGLIITEKNDILDIEIKDNGSGIPDDRIHSSDSLGLVGIKERVLRWNGTFNITGKPGEGTSLKITLPRSE